MNAVTTWAAAHPLMAAVSVLALAAVASAVWAASRRRTSGGRIPAAVVAAGFSAALCTAYSADISWRFAGSVLKMHSLVERGAMFAAAEVALFSVALMARHNIRAHESPGTPGTLVWLITGVQVIPAFVLYSVPPATLRAFFGPVCAALLWHLAMGIELRHAKPGAHSQSLPALLAREARERLLSRLGVARRGRDAEQITRDRWTAKAAALAAKLAETNRGGRGRARLVRRLSAAVGKAQAGASQEQRQLLLDLLAARRHATSLATVDLPSPWNASARATRQPATVEPVPAPVPEAASTPEYTPPPASRGELAPPLQAGPAPVAESDVLDSDGASEYAAGWPVSATSTRTRPAVHLPYLPEERPSPDRPEPDVDETGPEKGEEPFDASPPPPEEDLLTSQVRGDFRGDLPSFRALKETYGIGQRRAQRIRNELGAAVA